MPHPVAFGTLLEGAAECVRALYCPMRRSVLRAAATGLALLVLVGLVYAVLYAANNLVFGGRVQRRDPDGRLLEEHPELHGRVNCGK